MDTVADAPVKRGYMRECMPNVAAVIDEFREVFGAEVIDRGIRQMVANGEFYAEDHVTGKSFGAKRERVVLASGVGADGLRWVHEGGSE